MKGPTRKLSRVLVLLLCLCMVLGVCSCSKQQDFPNQSITVVIPKGAGGPTDTAARSLLAGAEKLDDKLSFVYENVTGANGVTGLVQGASAKPDGYTMTMVVAEINIMSNMASYNCPVSIDDYRFLSVVVTLPVLLCVRQDSEYTDIYDFVDDLSEGTRIGTSGTYGMGDLAMTASAQTWGKSYTGVPYNDGDTAAITALVADNPEVDAVVVCPSSTLDSQIQSGALRVLASFGENTAYDAPRVSELDSGYTVDLNVVGHCALAVPKDTPDDVYDYLEDVIAKATKEEEYVKAMDEIFMTASSINGDDARVFMENQHEFYSNLLASIGVD